MASSDVVPPLSQDVETKEKDVVVGAKRKRRQARRKTTIDEFLLSDKGIKALVGEGKTCLEKFKPKGMGYEIEDLESMLSCYVDWGFMLNSTVDFATLLMQIKSLNKGEINEHMNILREKQYQKLFASNNALDPSNSFMKSTLSNNLQENIAHETNVKEMNSSPAHPNNTQETAERIRRNREAAMAKRKALQQKKAMENDKVPSEQELNELCDLETDMQNSVREPDEDELSAYNDLLGQPDITTPKTQDDVKSNSYSRTEVESQESDPNEDTMFELNEAFMPRSEKSLPDSKETKEQTCRKSNTSTHESESPMQIEVDKKNTESIATPHKDKRNVQLPLSDSNCRNEFENKSQQNHYISPQLISETQNPLENLTSLDKDETDADHKVEHNLVFSSPNNSASQAATQLVNPSNLMSASQEQGTQVIGR